MSLIHDFVISEIIEYQKNRDMVKVDDNLIMYILDSLEWTESEWNELGEDKKGLNYYGITIFRGENLESLIKIISCWIELF
ncbi:coproporphyrinogen III oxidase [Listeria cornellensis FSL F6-0969]|uniref:Coproporphyrinogen III oxidase n=1 Tax=Listeria cornellensis FSL F6-0969 TaxID=1265820 RepID=W7BE41_9LIST|nr:coproporphyrinogen III oxidase [Listeria cornellensis FSL F6-0969]